MPAPWRALWTINIDTDGLIVGKRQDTTIGNINFNTPKYLDAVEGKIDYDGNMKIVAPTWGQSDKYRVEYEMKFDLEKQYASGTWNCIDVDHGTIIANFELLSSQ